MKYIIGVDGGGTKTEAVAYSLNGDVLDISLKGFGNLLNDEIKALNNITDSIHELIKKFGKENLQGIYLGIAGAEANGNEEKIKNSIKEKFDMESVVINDGHLALKALLKGEDGILVIAGTGSIAFGIKDEEEVRCGGWGHILGDEGSAYKIAIEAFKRMIYEYDFGLQKSNLSKELLNELNANDVNEIIGFIYESTKDEIASFAKIVSKHAENGDEYAKELLEKEGVALAKDAERVFRRLKFKSCKIGLVGGAIRRSKILREAFENYLNEKIDVIKFVDDDNVSAAKGAYYIHMKNN